ncbi:G patch domain-containing protein 1 homolog [Diabrotica virgifera virgifera]|uniref:G patch domain-containing protein n=3 Tax=Diabrotica virgifera virgifera TaxID=50390 RepID=A0ABM5KGP9_DIAVI|nr:G patch domain-containing protein 1 homolog [Diabrotica virgifera virgifera]
MSDEEEEHFCFFGTPLEQYDEDSFPKKKPISVEEQIATDAQGRRRFHGAFTGGFSAGFFNTVGSLEGWTPSEFKSTRQDKGRNVIQKPEDFMDQEDLDEHGIAPQRIRATTDYSTSKKRKKKVFSEGPIPGTPVLETLLTSGNETIGYLLLKKIGIKDKIKEQVELYSDTKVYGCQIPSTFKIPKKIENNQYKIPEIYLENLAKPKSNTFGLGYEGLDRSHVNLFSHSNLVVTDKNNKKISISGQGFGVGAFEEDDDDIYSKEDMRNYDFELVSEKQKQKVSKGSLLQFDMFKRSTVPLVPKKAYPPPTIPHSFTGKHKIKKSRFEPVEVKVEEDQDMDRGSINPAIRARYLGEETVVPTLSQPIVEQKPQQERLTPKQERPTPRTFDVSSLMTDRFVSASQSESTNSLEPVVKTETEHGTSDMRAAAKMDMFGPLTRITSDWRPHAVLYKRFNVAEPLIDLPEQKQRKRTKNLIFENQKHTDNQELHFLPGCSTNVDERENEADNSKTEDQEEAVKTEIPSPVEEKESPIEETQDVKIEQDMTEKIGIEDKVDLFKAVFLSSSESEEEEEEKEDEKKAEAYKETILSDLVPKIKPLKQGILSNINFQPINQIKEENQDKTEDSSAPKTILFVPRKDRSTSKKETQLFGHSLSAQTATEDGSNMIEIPTPARINNSDSFSYGPQLPKPKDGESIKTSFKTAVVDVETDDDEWIEKDESDKKSRHKKKSKKKKKHKHSKKEKH